MKPFVTSRSGFSTVAALTLVICLLSQMGCATIFHGRMEEIEVISEPPGARVLIEDKQISTTPGEIRVRMKRNLTLRFEREGYDPYEVEVKRRLSWKLLLNLYLSGYVGYMTAPLQEGWPACALFAFPWGIDFLTGAAFVGPSRIEVKLSELNDKKANR